MQGEHLYNYYEQAVLPQFGLNTPPYEWLESRRIAGDEIVHIFRVGEQKYTLLFEDYAGSALSGDYVREHIIDSSGSFDFVEPTSQSSMPPSYDGFKLAAPSRYCENVTGIFTLILHK